MKNFQKRDRFHDNRVSWVHYTGADGEQVKVQISYREGGINFASYKNEERGFQLVVTEVKLVTRNGTVLMEESRPFQDGNFRMLIQPENRYNAKRLEKLAGEWDEFVGTFAQLYKTDRPVALQMLREKLGLVEEQAQAA